MAEVITPEMLALMHHPKLKRIRIIFTYQLFEPLLP